MKSINLLLPFWVILFGIGGSAQTTLSNAESKTGNLIIVVHGIKNTVGQIKIALYNNSSDFLIATPYKGTAVNITSSEVIIKFDGIPYGEYAVAAIHDINKDGKLDINFLGIPTEGYGFSNDAMGKYGPPTWAQACFEFAQKNIARIIDLEYGIPGKK